MELNTKQLGANFDVVYYVDTLQIEIRTKTAQAIEIYTDRELLEGVETSFPYDRNNLNRSIRRSATMRRIAVNNLLVA